MMAQLSLLSGRNRKTGARSYLREAISLRSEHTYSNAETCLLLMRMVNLIHTSKYGIPKINLKRLK